MRNPLAGRSRVPVSSGCLIRSAFPDGRRYLIVHPSGNYNRRAPWSIPKGLVEPDESLEEAALRETLEETGLACRILKPLGEVHYRKSRKIVVAFLAEPACPRGARSEVAVVSEIILEPASWEVDAVEFCLADEARSRLHPDQQVLIDRAEREA